MRGPTSTQATVDGVANVSGNLPNVTKTEPSMTNNHHVICSRSNSNTSSHEKEDEKGTPIWKVGRILMDSLSKGKMRRTKIFGAPLEDLPLNCQGLPKIAHRLCCYLEQYGLKEPDLFGSCKKQAKMVERFKISFDRAGDADLEGCSDIRVVASLLKLWLHDLPSPLIPQRTSSRLKTLFQRYDQKEVYDLNAEICNVLVTCPALNLGVLYTVIRLLYFYISKWYPASYVDQLPETFAKILMGDEDIEHVEIITLLIHNFREIFNERVLERAFKLCVMRDKRTREDDRKRVNLPRAGECGNTPIAAVDKFTRSNSEEKLSIQGDCNRNLSSNNLKMRRVNSHEDFSGHSQHGFCRSVQVVIVDKHENDDISDSDNSSDYRITYRDQQYEEPIVDYFNRITYNPERDPEVLVAPPPFHYTGDYRIQEEIRNAERFTPQFNTYRNVGRRKHSYQGHNVKPKLKTIHDDNYQSKLSSSFDVGVLSHEYMTDSSSSPTEMTSSQESDTHSTSSTSSSSSMESCSPTKTSQVSPEPIQHHFDFSEPLTSYDNWSFAHRYPHNSIAERTIPLKSPATLSRHYDGVSSNAVKLSNIDLKILQVNKHLQWVKKKMKRFEEQFEDRFGEAPTITNKMAHPEYKHMSTSIIHLKHTLKQLRKEANENFSAHRIQVIKNPNNSFNLGLFSSSLDKEKAAQEAEKELCEKRIANERPESIEDMTHEQLLEEKVSIQKELLHLENVFGQTAARNEELFHSIYSRYRSVKRFLARSSASLKLKEAASDLGTIIENETMEFDSGNNLSKSFDEKSITACQPLCNAENNDDRISNIHELSSPELMMEYKTTREEKKRLRNRISMYEQETENKTLNDSKHCIHSLRIRYKSTKAKLKLLEALIMKTK